MCFKKHTFPFNSSSDQYEITTFPHCRRSALPRVENHQETCPLPFHLLFILETYIVKASITLTCQPELLVLFFHWESECQRAKNKCFPLSSHHSGLNCLPRTVPIKKTPTPFYPFFTLQLYK